MVTNGRENQDPDVEVPSVRASMGAPDNRCPHLPEVQVGAMGSAVGQEMRLVHEEKARRV
jgi:hypothetical protein